MSTNDGGPAYPVPDSHVANGQVQLGSYGMSLRDHFAGLAMQALIALRLQLPISAECHEAYRYADEMLRAREAGQ